MPISSHPYARTGRLIRDANFPANALPSANPPMNAARTVLTAKVVAPKTKPSIRAHNTS
jgi:hypothetical protein